LLLLLLLLKHLWLWRRLWLWRKPFVAVAYVVVKLRGA
jgi:hypothetical protein